MTNRPLLLIGAVISTKQEGSGIMEKETREILEKSFDPADIGKDYNKNAYVKPHLIIRRLNKAYGQDGWHFELLERIVEHDTIIQFGRLGIANDAGEMVWKENCGARRCSYIKGTEKRLDVGNDYKSAVSNCVKRCAMMHGIALDLYGDPEQSEQTGAGGSQKKQDAPNKPSTGNEQGASTGSASAGEGKPSGSDTEKARRACMMREAEVLGVLKKADRPSTIHALRTMLLGEGKAKIEDNPEAWDFYKALLDVEGNWYGSDNPPGPGEPG